MFFNFVSPEHWVGKKDSVMPLTQYTIFPHYDQFLIDATFSLNIRKQQMTRFPLLWTETAKPRGA